MKIYNTLIFIFLFTFTSFSQKEEVVEQPIFRPTIMVIPFVKEDEQLRTIYEKEEMLHLRVAVTKVKEGFEFYNIPTVDFRAKLKQISIDKMMEIGNQSSIKQEVIKISGADIYIEVESSIIQEYSRNSATVIATAYDAFSGKVLASEVGTITRRHDENFELLTQRAVKEFIKKFTYNIQNQFDVIIEEGRNVVVHIGFDENAEIDMDTEMDNGELFSDMIESWFEENAHNSNFHIQGVTATTMILDEVRVPVIDEKTGRKYRVTRFAAQIRSFLKKQNLEVTRDVVGSKIYINIK